MFFLIGAAAGALTGVPIGPVNVAVIDAAYRHTLRRAIAVGLGGALADGLYAALGVIGVKPFLDSYPSIPPILFLVSGLVLLAYGFLTARSQPVAPAQPPPDEAQLSSTTLQRREMWSGFTVGLALIILNPAAIVTWVVLIARLIPDASSTGGSAFAAGVMIGSFGWFALVAYLTHKGKSVLGDKAAWIPRFVGIALMVYSVYLLTKAVRYFIA
ncbi:MAG: LysE/ArgO family amino acid transporter [Kofleriaceae bacterium]